MWTLIHASLVAFATALSVKQQTKSPSYGVKERHELPQAWTRVGPAPGDQVLDIKFGLKQSSLDDLERHLFQVSEPIHQRYGQHLSADDVAELVRPTEQTLRGVLEWLVESNGVAYEQISFSSARDWISVPLTVHKAELLLQTTYYEYVHKHDDTRLIRTPEWSLPMHLHQHIDAVHSTTFQNQAHERRLKKREAGMRALGPQDLDCTAAASAAELEQIMMPHVDVSAVCNAAMVTPMCLRTLYGTKDYVPAAAGKNKIAIANFHGQKQNQGDLEKFIVRFRPDAKYFDFDDYPVTNVEEDLNDIGAAPETHTGLEAALDSEIILGMTIPTPLIAYSASGSPPYQPNEFAMTNTKEPWLSWLLHVLALPDDHLPYTISISYSDEERTVPRSYARRICNLFAQLGARGVSVLVSAGDKGVGENGTCSSSDGTHEFVPRFPASCPYVTVVGGTMGFSPEVAGIYRQYTSGGGFSNYFQMPSYQEDAVTSYVASLGGEFDGLYNRSGRAYPDISAQSVEFVFAWDGAMGVTDGTSCATPTAASVISLLNDARLAAGQPTLGFLNPLLYQSLHTGFTDVVSGSAIGCNETKSPQGFPAKKGWDAVTGFGTPYFPTLRDMVVKSGHFP